MVNTKYEGVEIGKIHYLINREAQIEEVKVVDEDWHTGNYYVETGLETKEVMRADVFRTRQQAEDYLKKVNK